MKLVNFYEVTEKAIWNEEDPEEPRLVTDKIEVSSLVLATILDERDKA